ncbi:MAG: hypothetical protein KC501_32070, partial [Myxococcales bacterium]|nr:hypothetical protein [Myxococcales bacterium]
MPSPGPVAFLVFYLWIPISAILFSQKEPRKAGFIAVIWGTMWLPELVSFDLPILPAIDKHVLVGLCAFVGLYLTSKERRDRMRLLRGMQLFFFFFAVGNVGTAMTNPESFTYGGQLAWEGGPRFPVVNIEPLPKKEFIAMTIQDFFKYVMPMGAGQMLVQSRDDAIVFLKSFVFACLVYVPLMLWEGMMSPQLHRQVYGYYALNFAHNVRGDGYKPVIMMKSGLGVAMFEFVGLCGAITLARLKHKITPMIPAGLAALAILFALAVSRNVAVVVYAAAVIPVLWFMKARTQARIGLVLGLVFLSFPITRAKGWFPADEIVQFATEKVGPDRAASLAFRFDNENILLEHTQEKPWFGWGSYGRNRKYDPDTGQDISVTDGEWAIHYSVRGAVGAIGWFWLVGLPILWGARFIRRVHDPQDQLVLGAMVLTHAINAADLLPNSSFTIVPFVYAGCLTGYLQHLNRKYGKNARPVAATARGPAR